MMVATAFSEAFDSLRDRLGWAGKAVPVCAGMALMATVMQGPELGLTGACEGVVVCTAIKLADTVVNRLVNRDAGASSSLPSHVARELEGIPTGQAVAVERSRGKWIVRKDSEDGYRVMGPTEFSSFEADVARFGGIMNKVRVDDDKVTISRHVGGRLDGLAPDAPAIRVVRDGNQVEVAYAHQGTVIARSGTQPATPGADVAMAARERVETMLHGRPTDGDPGSTHQDTWLAIIGPYNGLADLDPSSFREGDLCMIRPNEQGTVVVTSLRRDTECTMAYHVLRSVPGSRPEHTDPVVDGAYRGP